MSVHDILSPPPVTTFVTDQYGVLVTRIDFDPYQGWSWREVLVWAADAARAAREKEVDASQADWQKDEDRFASFAAYADEPEDG